MRLVSISPTPEAQCVEPILVLDIVIAFQRGQRIPLDLTVEVRTEDNKLLGVARPTTMGGGENLTFDANESGTSEASLPARVVLGLSPKQMDYLEGLRSKHRKGDVVLNCQVHTNFLVSKTVLATLQPAEGQGSDGNKPVVYKPERVNAFETGVM